MQIAVISDLHVGETAFAPEFVPPFDLKDLPDHAFLSKFKRLILSESIRPDFLVVPGDLSNKGDPVEIFHAWKLISHIADLLHVPASNILIAPGNHDVSWKITEHVNDRPGGDYWFQRRFDPLNFEEFKFAEYLTDGTRSLVKAPYFIFRKFGSLEAIIINTAAFDIHLTKPHHGRVDQQTIAEIATLLSNEAKTDSLRIAVFHHHCFQYPSWTVDDADFSIMQNAQPLLEALVAGGCEFIVHGHRHAPNFSIPGWNGQSVPLLCAGSFSQSLPPHYAGTVCNQFHLIDIQGRDAKSLQPYGYVKSWAYAKISGWRKSIQNADGIEHGSPFGTYGNLHDIVTRVIPIADAEIVARGHIRWSEVQARALDLKYLPASLRTQSFSEMRAKHALKIEALGDEDFLITRAA